MYIIHELPCFLQRHIGSSSYSANLHETNCKLSIKRHLCQSFMLDSPGLVLCILEVACAL